MTVENIKQSLAKQINHIFHLKQNHSICLIINIPCNHCTICSLQKYFFIFLVPFPHSDAIHCNWEEIYFLSPQLNSVLCRTAFGEAAPESGIFRGACQEGVTTCCKAGPKAALQGTAPGRVACLEFAGGEKRKTNIAADYAVKVSAFTALLCRHIGSIRTFLKS